MCEVCQAHVVVRRGLRDRIKILSGVVDQVGTNKAVFGDETGVVRVVRDIVERVVDVYDDGSCGSGGHARGQRRRGR